MVLLNDDTPTERITLWQCIGCGRIEHPRPCIGICQDQKVEFVSAATHEERVAQLRHQIETLATVVRHIALITPRAQEWERSYRALQGEARRALAVLAPDTTTGDT